METDNKGQSVNKLMIIGTIVNAAIVLFVTVGADTDEMPAVLGLILLAFLAINVIGLIVSSFSKGKAGPLLIIIGSIAFIPIGGIALFGARQVLDARKREAMDLES